MYSFNIGTNFIDNHIKIYIIFVLSYIVLKKIEI